MTNDTYRPTRFLSYSTSSDGSLMVYNSLTGALGAVPPHQTTLVKDALKRSKRIEGPLEGIYENLREGGFLIPEDFNEEKARDQIYLDKYNDDTLQLIVLPTEDCNFRCVYCYESFARGKMDSGLVEGIKKYVGNQQLKTFSLSWFGGEPLLASDVVVELTQHFFNTCASNGTQFSAGITTNGSLLTPEIVESLVPFGLTYFQITLDGIKEEHDVRRIPIDGKDSYDRIINNLRYLKSTNYSFVVALRHNFDPKGMESIDKFIDNLANEFGGDPRFTTMFEAIGTWGGANDDELVVCEGRSANQSVVRAKQLAVQAGIRNTFQVEGLQPNGHVCYAANPRSFVIGSDGKVYKCTVELDYHDRNIVGQLSNDGSMTLDWRKMALWTETNGRDTGKKCNTCFFSPSCHGAVCPKQWMDLNDCECPPTKATINDTLQVIQLEMDLPEPEQLFLPAKCSK